MMVSNVGPKVAQSPFPIVGLVVSTAKRIGEEGSGCQTLRLLAEVRRVRVWKLAIKSITLPLKTKLLAEVGKIRIALPLKTKLLAEVRKVRVWKSRLCFQLFGRDG